MFISSIIVLPSIVCLVFAILLITNRNRHMLADKILAINLILNCVNFFCFYSFYEYDYSLFYKLDIINAFTLSLIYPTSILYFNILIKNAISLWQKLLLFAFPVILALTITSIYIYLGEEQSSLFVKYAFYKQDVVIPNVTIFKALKFLTKDFFNIVIMCQIAYLIYNVLHLIRSSERSMGNFFSNFDRADRRSSYHLLLWIIFCGIFSIIQSSIPSLRTTFSNTTIGILSTLYSIAIFSIGRIALFFRYTTDDFLEAEKAKKEMESDLSIIKNSDENPDDDINDEDISVNVENSLNIVDKKLTMAMENEKIYRQTSITINDLAIILCTNRTYISKVINQKYNKSFSEYINEYRIHHAMELMKSTDKHYSMEFISEESGFTNPSTFYRAFKAIVGETPTSWSKKNIE